MASTPASDIQQGPPRPPIDDGFGGGGGGGDGWGGSRRVSFTGLYVMLAAIVMFFAALTSAFVFRREFSETSVKLWRHTPLPWIIWMNSCLLGLSSAALEAGRRALKSGHRDGFSRLWTAGTLLGIGFLGGQCLAWIQVYEAGYLVKSNASAGFFYIFTVGHAAHLLGGVVALLYVAVQAWRLRLGPGKRTAADVIAVYWHFLFGLWVYLLALLAIWG
jgi:cytochrome c oxidase subunit 3